MPLEDLRAGYDALHRELEGAPSKYAVEELVDEIPAEGGNTASLEVLFRDASETTTLDAFNEVWKRNEAYIASLGEEDTAKVEAFHKEQVRRIIKLNSATSAPAAE